MKNLIIKFGIIIASCLFLLAGNPLLFDALYMETEKEESLQIEEYADDSYFRKIYSSLELKYSITPLLFYRYDTFTILHQSFTFTVKCERSPPGLKHFFFV